MVNETKTDFVLPDLQAILDFLPVRIFWKDLDLVYQGGNQRFAEDCGFECPADIVGKTDFEMAWVEHAEMYRRDDTDVLTSGCAKISYEEPQRRKNGTSWLRTSKQPLFKDGKIVGVVGTYEDITRERSHQQAAQLKRRMEAVGRLAAGVAHDFNNILTPITGFAELLANHLPDDRETRNHKGNFDRAIVHAQALSKQLVLHASESAPAESSAVLNEVVQNIAPMLGKMGNNLVIETQTAEMSGSVPVSAIRLERVLINLVNNSCDAMANGGKILISTQLTETPRDNSGPFKEQAIQWALLTVADDGPGIPAAVREVIFEQFVTTKTSSSAAAASSTCGTGLGLSVCKEIVESAGGTIRLENHDGQGAVFQIYLPLI